MWVSITSGLILGAFAVTLIVQLLNRLLRRYASGVVALRGFAGYRQRLFRLDTLTPYKTIIVVAAAAVGAVGALV
jgi:hypothetical protein